MKLESRCPIGEQTILETTFRSATSYDTTGNGILISFHVWVMRESSDDEGCFFQCWPNGEELEDEQREEEWIDFESEDVRRRGNRLSCIGF